MIKDARSLSPEAQEALRFRVVNAVNKGMKHIDAVKIFQVSRSSTSKWINTFKAKGESAIKAKRRGRIPVARLKGHQAATIVRIITDKCPEQVKLPFVLWTREAVQQLIAERYSLQLSIWTIGRYLHQWGFTPQKPQKRAYEQNNEEVKEWLSKEYPKIKRRASRLKAEIHWEDETGMRSDHQAGTSWSPKGKTPVIPCTGKRFSLNMISSITNKGTLAFRLFKGKFFSDVFIDFMKRLVKHRRRKIFLIVDSHPVHKSKKVEQWLKQNKKRIEMYLLPTYSPELNPDELLNQDVKSNAVGRQRARDVSELEFNLGMFLHQRQNNPDIVKSYFHKHSVIYAA